MSAISTTARSPGSAYSRRAILALSGVCTRAFGRVPGRPLGMRPRDERRLDLGQHRVQRPREPAQLGGGIAAVVVLGVGHAPGEVAGADRGGRFAAIRLGSIPTAMADILYCYAAPLLRDS